MPLDIFIVYDYNYKYKVVCMVNMTVKNKKVTLKQVAAAAELAVPTVSQILNGRRNFCSQEQIDKVRRIAKELNYRPNIGYKIMTGQQTQTVAILNSMPQMSSEEHVLKLIMLLIAGFDKRGYASYCSTFTDDPAKNLEKVRTLVARGVERFVFLGCPFGHTEIIRELEALELPFSSDSLDFSRRVDRGSQIGAEALFSHIVSTVGENFKLVCQEKEAHDANMRVKALAKAIGISCQEAIAKFIFTGSNVEFDVEDYAMQARTVAYKATRRLLEKHPDIGAICYVNDKFAIGGGCCILEKGNERFRHILLSGFNNEPSLEKFPLPIISTEFRLEKIADALVENVLVDEPHEIVIPPTLVIRTACECIEYPHWNEKRIDLTI